METGNLAGQGFDQLAADPVHQIGQDRVRIEAAHAYRPVDRRSVAVHPRCLGRPGDRANPQIDLWRQPSIQAQFLETGLVAGLEIDEVEEPQIQRFLELIGQVTGQDHAGDVGVDPAPRSTALRPGRGPHERPGQGLVLLQCLNAHR